MRKGDVFPSKWLKADDLVDGNGRPISPVVTIAGVYSQTIQDRNTKEDKILRVLQFIGTDKELPLNMTNWDSCAQITGFDDDDHWAGFKLQLFRTMVDSPTGRQWGIRIRPEGGWDNWQGPQSTTRAAKPATQPAAEPDPPAEPEPELEPDDLPF